MLDQLKSTQPRDITKSIENVSKLKDAILSYFLNPFSSELEKDQLYHLVSASPVDESIAISLLSIKENAIELKNDFVKREIPILIFFHLSKNLKFAITRQRRK